MSRVPRLLSLALLACPPDERHDLGLIAFGVVLRDRGWRITFLGPDTPIETLLITGGQHSWLYEFPEYRRAVASFAARALGGPLSPEAAEKVISLPGVLIPSHPGRTS